MTESPPADRMGGASVDVRRLPQHGIQGVGAAELVKPKRWYDDDPGQKVPVIDLSNPEKVGPILKEGGYRRATKENRVGALRGNAIAGEPAFLPPI